MVSAPTALQDRTAEFRSIVEQAKRRQFTKPGAQRLLSDAQRVNASGNEPKRTEFARKAATIGRGISATMAKLGKLAQLAKRRNLFEDNPVEFNELTYILKQDLNHLNREIAELQLLNSSQREPQTGTKEHNKNVVLLLQGKLSDVGANFKNVLETRSKNMMASKSRTDQFVASVSQHTQPPLHQRASPLYGTSSRNTPTTGSDLITLQPPGGNQQQQLLMMEEAQPQSMYIQQRGQAIEAIESTINELGSIFGQLAQMVADQSEQIERIDATTEDIVDNVAGAQRELLKYWSRVSGNRWLVAKMFGVLMIFFLLWVLIAG